MKSPMLYVIRQLLIEGRKHTQGQQGRPIRIPTLGIRCRFLAHPSAAPHYIAVKQAVSGTWRFQKTTEVVQLSNQQVWECAVFERIERYVPNSQIPRLTEFVQLAYQEKLEKIWLDDRFCFWTKEWDEWVFVYEAEGFFDQFLGTGKAYRRGTLVYTGVCSGGITRD